MRPDPGKPNVDACELAREELCLPTPCFPDRCRVCSMTALSGSCLFRLHYRGAKLILSGNTRTWRGGTAAIVCGAPERIAAILNGRTQLCLPPSTLQFYSGTKALAEEPFAGRAGFISGVRNAIQRTERAGNLLWRLQITPGFTTV